MKQIFFLIFALTSIAKTYAQQTCTNGEILHCNLLFSYDDAGNRIQRGLQYCYCAPSMHKSAGGSTTTDNTDIVADAVARTAGSIAATDAANAKDAATTARIASVAPNPTTNSVTVQFSGVVEKGSILITDGTGRLLAEQAVSGSSTEIDLSAYSAGIYYLSLRTAAAIHTQKVVKIE
jgi:Secretion system C-terminal sorting domain